MNSAETVINLYKDDLRKTEILKEVRDFLEERIKKELRSLGASDHLLSDDKERNFFETKACVQSSDFKNLVRIKESVNVALLEKMRNDIN